MHAGTGAGGTHFNCGVYDWTREDIQLLAAKVATRSVCSVMPRMRMVSSGHGRSDARVDGIHMGSSDTLACCRDRMQKSTCLVLI